jgi:glycosyltransferase involved in cell wall biosynthesis
MTIDLVIPVLDEEAQLEASVRRLLSPGVPDWPTNLRLIIADNGSTDRTPEIAQRLAEELSQVSHLWLEERGRGRALKQAWSGSEADILAYMDVDLSTGLEAFPRLLAPLIAGRADVAIGCRLHPAARVVRRWQREFISRAYNRLAQVTAGARVRDLQCGFKAITRNAARRLLPLIEDTGWFFDTELLLLAGHLGFRVQEEPVGWTDDPDSRVRLCRTAWEDWKGLLRVRRSIRQGRFGRPITLQTHPVR